MSDIAFWNYGKRHNNVNSFHNELKPIFKKKITTAESHVSYTQTHTQLKLFYNYYIKTKIKIQDLFKIVC